MKKLFIIFVSVFALLLGIWLLWPYQYGGEIQENMVQEDWWGRHVAETPSIESLDEEYYTILESVSTEGGYSRYEASFLGLSFEYESGYIVAEDTWDGSVLFLKEDPEILVGDAGVATPYLRDLQANETSTEDLASSWEDSLEFLSKETGQTDAFSYTKMRMRGLGSSEWNYYFFEVEGRDYLMGGGDLDDESQLHILYSIEPLSNEALLLDYYLSIPVEYFSYNAYTEVSDEERLSYIDFIDEENFYIKFNDDIGAGGGDYGAFAVFIKPDGSHVIAVEGGTMTTLSFRTLYLLEYDAGDWTDVTGDLLDLSGVDFDALIESIHATTNNEGDAGNYPYSFYFEVPQYGTDLVLWEYLTGQEALVFQWRQGVFEQ